MKKVVKANPLVELKEYKIISQFFDKNDDEDNLNSIDILLPTPESMEKLCNPQIVKDILNFNLTKYNSFFETKNEDNYEDEITYLNLDKISFIKNKEILPFILIFLGGINTINTLYDFFEGLEVQKDEQCIDNSENYLTYLFTIIDFLKKCDKINIPFNQMESLFSSLDELGINIPKEDKNVLYRRIKDSFFLMEKNKILILLAPSNNFWIKSEKNSINDQNYDIKLNNYSNIFYNKNFIKKFLSKITNHPRCSFGLISSMTYKNLKNCWDALEKQFSNDCPKKVIFIDQKSHEKLTDESNKKKFRFFRSMAKILEQLDREKSKGIKKRNNIEIENDIKENVSYFNEKNILILESEEDKMSEDTKNNSIHINVFNQRYLEFNEQNRASVDLESDKAINYIIDLLENCTDDVRQYINLNKISNEYSFASS